jgi:hypothetical protein
LDIYKWTTKLVQFTNQTIWVISKINNLCVWGELSKIIATFDASYVYGVVLGMKILWKVGGH